jgi:PAS domain S-box-containing protein
MGGEPLHPTAAPVPVRKRDRGHRSLILSAAAISVVALVACWLGSGSIIRGIVNYEGRQIATQWALAFAHSLTRGRDGDAGAANPFSGSLGAEKLKPLDNAMFEGEILGYRIFDRSGTIVAASEFQMIGNRDEGTTLGAVLRDGESHARLIVERDTDETETRSVAIAPLVWGGRIEGAIGIEVDMSARAGQLARFRNLAMLFLGGLLAAVTGMMGASVSRTLARHRRTEDELLRSEEQYRSLLEGSRSAIVIHDCVKVLYANPAAARLHGAAGVGELIGLDPSALVPEEFREAMYDRRARFFETGEVAPAKVGSRRRLNGSRVETDAFTSGVVWNGRPCILVQAWDVSTELRAQRAVAESEARLSALISNAPFAVCIKDTGNRVLVANQVFREIAGCTDTDLVGCVTEDLVPKALADDFDAKARHVIETGQNVHFEIAVPTAGAEPMALLADKFPVRTPDGKIIGVATILRDITEERARERKTVESEARLRGFLEYSNTVMFMKDTDRRMTLVNRRYEEFFGTPAEKIIGNRIGNWISEEGAAIAELQDRRVVETGQPVSHEIDFVRADGAVRTVLSEKFPVFGPDGKLLEIGGINTDITFLKQKEHESEQARMSAERAEQRLMAFLNHSMSTVYMKGTDLRITLVNRAMEQHFGRTADELVGATARDFMPKAVADEIETIECEILRTGEPMSMETDLVRNDGEKRSFVLEKFPIFSATGEVVGIGGISTDITEAKEKSRAIVESEARLKAFLDHAPFMTILSAPDRTLINVNREYETFFGVRNADVVGLRDRPWLPVEFQQLYVGEQKEIMCPGTIIERTIEMPNAGGVPRLLRQTKFPIVLRDGTVVAVGTIMIDVTEQKEYERDLERARDDAEAANRAKSAFLANMSHEIRTPMNGVLGMADLLSTSALSKDQQRLLNTIRRSGEALLGVINNVLDVSRIEAREFRLDETRFDLHELVAEAVDLFAESSSAKGVEIAHHIGRDVPAFVIGDDIRLRQVLINLVGNAIKFTAEGEVVVRLTRLGGPDAAPQVRFEISDTGIGIPADKRAALFDAFKQVDDSITRKYGGSGLGLSIAQHIVTLMGGRIDVDSEPGAGSTFAFTIAMTTARERENRPEGDNAALVGRRILIVDDNATNREIFADFASGWRMDHESADGGETALARLFAARDAGRPFDVAVIDIVMPGMGGLELARRVRSERRLDGTRLVAMTSFNWDRDSAHSRESGFSHFVTKPVRRREIAALLRSILGESDGVPAEAEGVAEGAPPALLRNATVLIAEDNPVNLEIAQQYLEREGCRVVTASDGNEAVAAFAESSFDLVLMDVQMPELDGIEATRMIREAEARTGRRRTPVIAATAHAFREDREKCILAGMDDFLSKPFTRKDLLPLLDRWLGPGEPMTRAEAGEPPNDAAGSFETEAEPLLDPEALRQIRSLDPDGSRNILAKLVGMFMESTPPKIDVLLSSLADGDANRAGAIAHGLKTSAANVAALRLSELFREIERSARSGDIGRCREAAGRLEADYAEVGRSLAGLLSGNAPMRESA